MTQDIVQSSNNCT